MMEREHLHELVDHLPDEHLAVVARYLESITPVVDPLQAALDSAPKADEQLSKDDMAALAEAEQDIAAGRVVSHEEARRQLLGES